MLESLDAILIIPRGVVVVPMPTRPELFISIPLAPEVVYNPIEPALLDISILAF
jgi:hypothetical protein